MVANYVQPELDLYECVQWSLETYLKQRAELLSGTAAKLLLERRLPINARSCALVSCKEWVGSPPRL